MLVPLELLPRKGERVPHLFSSATREHLSDEIRTMSAYYSNPINGPCELVHWFDGEKVRKITAEKAAEIGKNHSRKLNDAFWKESQKEKMQYA